MHHLAVGALPTDRGAAAGYLGQSAAAEPGRHAPVQQGLGSLPETAHASMGPQVPQDWQVGQGCTSNAAGPRVFQADLCGQRSISFELVVPNIGRWGPGGAKCHTYPYYVL